MKSKNIKRILTENPFVDSIMYYSRYLAINALVKYEEKANASETLESMKSWNIYCICKEGRANFNIFDSFPIEVLSTALYPKYTMTHIKRYFLNDKFQIPEIDRPILVETMSDYVLNNYTEFNDYYRVLLGLRPSTDTVEIPLEDYDLGEYDFLKTEYKYFDQLDRSTRLKLDSMKIIDDIISDYEDKEYLNNIGKDLDIYTIRKAEDFDLIYLPDIEEDTLRTEYADRWLINRSYTLKCIYSEAFKYDSDYYNEFIAILITVMTICDMCTEMQDHIVRRDVFDERCIKYIFEQYGIPYYDEIPVKYQKNIMKNLNRLLKFKSTATCMIDICSLFGFDDIKIFQLYLLRSRNLNSDGDYVFNYTIEKEPINCEPTEIKDSVNVEVPLATGKVSIPIPFEDYFSKGNKIIVYLDDVIVPDLYYYILDGYLIFPDKSVLEGKSRLTYKFLYNETEIPLESIPDRRINITEENFEWNPEILTYHLNPPIQNYFEIGGLIYVILGSIQVQEDIYIIDRENNTITFTNEKFIKSMIMRDKNLKIRYLYSSTFDLHHKDVSVIATEAKQTQFKVPEPVPGYVLSNSKMYITKAGTYINPDRYHITDSGYLIFNDNNDYVTKGRNLVFHFIWNDFNEVEMTTVEESIKATEAYQTEFELHLPYPNYIADGNSVFVTIRGIGLSSTSYEILQNKLIITDRSYYVNKNSSVLVQYVYCTISNSKHSSYSVTANIDKQMEFEVVFPFDNFLTRGNKMTVTYRGHKYEEDIDYNVEGNRVYIYNVTKAVDIDTNIKFDFYYIEDNKDFVEVKTTLSKPLVDNLLIFGIEFPYYRYLETGNSFFVTVGSIYIDPSLYTVAENKLIFNDKMWNILKTRNVSFTFIYHTIYEQFNKSVHMDAVSRTLDNGIEVIGDDLKVPIPFPFDNYLELGNSFFMDVNGHTIKQKDYDVIDNKFVLIYNKDETVFKYGDAVSFTFIYTCTGLRDVIVEDLAKDISLKFVKIPINENPDKYLKDISSHLDYDQVVDSDPTWKGELTREEVKKEIINRQFNYSRSKYFSLTSITSMADLAYQLPYFMNILFDKRRTEERLKLSVPFISESHQFRFNDILVYMFALTHMYYGIEDSIPTTQDKVLYVKGFNFEASLAELSSRLCSENNVVNPSDYGFDNFITKNNQIPSYNRLIEIYTQNTEIFNMITDGLRNAKDKDEYDIQIALGVSNRTPCICQAMYDCMKPGDIVLSAPPSGKSTTVLVKYFLDDSAAVSNNSGINDKNDQVMTLSQLKTNFKAYFNKKKPNYRYPGPLYGMVFYIIKHDLGISLQNIISGEISLNEYESIIRNHFSNLGSTNLSGRTSAYKDAMKNFLEFIEDEHLKNIKVIG